SAAVWPGGYRLRAGGIRSNDGLAPGRPTAPGGVVRTGGGWLTARHVPTRTPTAPAACGTGAAGRSSRPTPFRRRFDGQVGGQRARLAGRPGRAGSLSVGGRGRVGRRQVAPPRLLEPAGTVALDAPELVELAPDAVLAQQIGERGGRY